MRVIILGAGQVGFSIARYLAFEGNDITVVDQSPELLKKISDKIDIQPVVGFASHPDTLKQARAENADMLIAVTGSDEVNMVACEVANSLFNVKTKIARIRHQSYLKNSWANLFHPVKLSIDVVISPELEVAKALNRSTQVVGAFDVIPLANDLMKVIGVKCLPGAPIINTPLRLMPNLFPRMELAILCIARKDEVIFPTKHDVLFAGDEIHFLVEKDKINLAMEAFGYVNDQKHTIVVIGAGTIGFSLIQEMEATQGNASLKLIEKSPERAEMAARVLNKTDILCGDALDLEVLTEASVSNSEIVVSVTEDDKVNILSALLCKQQGAKRVLTLLNNMAHSGLVSSLGVDAIINPRNITVSTILQHVRKGRIQSVHSLGDEYGEIIEAEATESSQIIGLSIDDVTIHGAIIIAALIRGEEIVILPNRMVINVGDRLVIVAKKEAVGKVEKLFSLRPSYL